MPAPTIHTPANPVIEVDLNGNPIDAPTTTAGRNVQGNVASGATDAGNPIKIGGVYKSTLPAYNSGQRGDALIDTYGNLRTLANLIITSGSDASNNDLLGFPQSFNVGGATRLLPTNANYVFNGTSWDRQRGNTNGTFVQGTVSVTAAVLPDGTDRSGTIATAATAQQVAPANITRTGLTFQNTSDTVMRVTENGTPATATTGYQVAVGQVVNISTNKAISVYCAAAGKTFSSTETP